MKYVIIVLSFLISSNALAKYSPSENLFRYCVDGKLKLSEMLIKRKNLNVQDMYEYIVREWPYKKPHLRKCLDFLQSKGAKYPYDNYINFTIISGCNSNEEKDNAWIQYLFEHDFNVNKIVGPWGEETTYLKTALKRKCFGVARKLLNKGADPDLKDPLSETVGSITGINILVGANVRVYDRHLETAMESGCEQCAVTLYDAVENTKRKLTSGENSIIGKNKDFFSKVRIGVKRPKNPHNSPIIYFLSKPALNNMTWNKAKTYCRNLDLGSLKVRNEKINVKWRLAGGDWTFHAVIKYVSNYRKDYPSQYYWTRTEAGLPPWYDSRAWVYNLSRGYYKWNVNDPKGYSKKIENRLGVVCAGSADLSEEFINAMAAHFDPE